MANGSPRRQNAVSTSWGTSTSRTVSFGFTPRVGNLLIAFVHLPNTDSETVVTTSGGAAWAKIDQTVWNTSAHHMSVWVKVAGALDTSIDITWSTSVGYGACVVLEYQTEFGTALDSVGYDRIFYAANMRVINQSTAATLNLSATFSTVDPRVADRGTFVAAVGLFSGSGNFAAPTSSIVRDMYDITQNTLARTQVIDGTIVGEIIFGSWFASLSFNWTTNRTAGAIGLWIPPRTQGALLVAGCN